MGVAFYRLLFATMLLGLWGLATDPRAFRALRGRMGPIVLAGLLLAIHFGTWIASLALTTVAASLFLVTTHPVIVALASHGRGERMTWRGWAGIGLSLAGAAVILFLAAGSSGSSGCSSAPSALTSLAFHLPGTPGLWGDVLAFVGAVAIALYLIVARTARQSIPLIPYTTATYAVASAALLLLTLADREQIAGFGAHDLLIFLALALVPMILGHTVLNWAIRWVRASIISTSILGEPIAGSLLALAVLGQAPDAATIVGGILVLFGIGLVVTGQADAAPAEPAG
jgi:drug/metabolite transporter (DMT)-like permease